MDKKYALKRGTVINKNKLFLTRFNNVYEDPKILLAQYLKGGLKLYDICKKCFKGRLEPEFRGVLYRMFLNIIPYDEPHHWIRYITEARNTYKTLQKELINSNVHIIPFMNCEDKKGTDNYEKYSKLIPHADYELIGIIKLDVDRTFQELDLFHNKKIKELLCKILYIYSKRNSDPSYCQGMNEILGTLLYALLPSITLNGEPSHNFQNNLSKSEFDPEYIFDQITNDEYFEMDLYLIYDELMSRDLKELYTYNDSRFRKKTNFEKRILTLEDIYNSEDSELGKRIKKIFYVYLKILDVELYEYLIDQVEPDIFLFRWILCMLNREISLKNVIRVWDCILAYEFVEFTVNTVETDKSRLNYLDYLCLGMILDLKPNLLAAEEGGMLLMNFLQYPNEKNINHVMKLAKQIGIKLNNGDLWEDKKLKENRIINNINNV